MHPKPRRLVGTIAIAATVFIGSSVESAPTGQARGTLSVRVQVFAACGGAVGTGGQATAPGGCAPGGAPLAVLTESAAATPKDAQSTFTARIEGPGELRYVTLIY